MAHTYNTGLKSVASAYSRLINARISPSTLETLIEENPNYPSLLSLSDAYHHFNVPNNAYHLPGAELGILKAPFIAFIDVPGTGKDFVLVSAIDEKTVTYIHKKAKRHLILRDDFLQRYQNIVFLAEPGDDSGEPDFAEKAEETRKEKLKQRGLLSAGILLLVLLFFIGFSGGNGLAWSSLFLLNSWGLITSLMLLVYQIDKDNQFVRHVCAVSENTSCDSVLSSSGSTIMGISWSEIGFFYFAAAWIWLLFPGLTLASKISYIAIAGACAVLYVPYSIYYQWKIVKKWCPLCLSVQAVLLSGFIWIAFYYRAADTAAAFTSPVLASVLFCTILPVAGWYAVRPYFGKIKDSGDYKAAYHRLLYNPDVFDSLLQRQAKAPAGWRQLGIDLGDPKAGITITSVCSLYCGHCADAHLHFSRLIQVNKQVNVKLIFRTPPSFRNKGSLTAGRLMEIAKQGDHEKNRMLIEDWYSSKGKEQFSFSGYSHASSPPPTPETADQQTDLQKMASWCEEAEITHTPTIFINGYRLPDGYKVEELKHIFH